MSETKKKRGRGRPVERKTVFIESAGGTLPTGVHFDQVVSEHGLRNYFILYQNGKIIDTKEKMLVERRKKVDLYTVPYGYSEKYPFNFGMKNLPPRPYGKVIDLWHEVSNYNVDQWDYHDKDFYDVMVAWQMSTWLPEKWEAVGYMGFIGDSGTGKTRGLECNAALSYRSWFVTCLNEAPLFRGVTQYEPTVCIDETEIITKADRSTVQNLLNSGQRRGVMVPRVEQPVKGVYTIKGYELFGYKCLAGTRQWLRTLQRRSIIAYTTRNVRKVTRFIDKERAQQLRRKLLQYRIDFVDVPFAESKPKILKLTEILSGGVYEIFYPLFSVAPSEKWKSLMKYALKEEDKRQRDRSTSDLAVVFFAILELKGEYIYVAQITDLLNQDRELRLDQYTKKTVSQLATVLGFAKKHMRRGTVIIWNDVTVERLTKQYGTGKIPVTGDVKDGQSALTKIFNKS